MTFIDSCAAQAPCFTQWIADGAKVRCGNCNELSNDNLASDFVIWFTPNGKRGVSHKACLDEAWLTEFAHEVKRNAR